VLAERGIEPRKSNGKKVYDLDYEKPKNMDTGGYGNDLNYPSFSPWNGCRKQYNDS
jgi:hypothetical protein